MGEIADMILDGDMCQSCGEDMEGDGYPQSCSECSEETVEGNGYPQSCFDNTPEKINCPICNKIVKKIGLTQHKKAVHND